MLRAPRQVALVDVVPPEPGPHQVRVRLDGAGICASELPLWEGRDWFTYPRAPGAPGHEGWGSVDAVGEGVEGLVAGQRVALISEHAHAELDVAPAAAVVALPAELGADTLFPGEPLACAINAVARAAVQSGQRVAVVGAGFQALLIVQLCAAVAGELAVISRRDSALELADALGASATWRTGDPALAARRESYDVVFETTGHQEPLDLASGLVRVRGRLVVVGYHQDGSRRVDMQSWNWRGLDVINAHERDPAVYAHGLREAVRAVLAGRLDPSPLLSHTFSLSELGDAYRVAVKRPEGFVKAIWRRD